MAQEADLPASSPESSATAINATKAVHTALSKQGASSKDGLIIEIAPAEAADNVKLVEEAVDVVNKAYAAAEGDIFKSSSYKRTNAPELAQLIREGRIALAYATYTSPGAAPERRVVGSVCVQIVSPTLGNFGMLALDPAMQGHGMGGAVVRFVEEHCRSRGCTTMQLELLVPTEYHHAIKARTQAWYQRLGYTIVKLGSFQEDYPALAPLLAGPCEYRVFEKPLN